MKNFQERFQRVLEEEPPEQPGSTEYGEYYASLQDLFGDHDHIDFILTLINDPQISTAKKMELVEFAAFFLPLPKNDREKKLRVQLVTAGLQYAYSKSFLIFGFLGIIANTAIMKKVAQIAPLNDTVLIEGETGTGKELIAKAMHFRSNRRANSFIAVNCASIPETLFESELFGHVRGAFSGAHDKIGYLQAANNGTLFIDEIGDMPMQVQTKLLRALNDKTIVRLGDDPRNHIHLDIRIICATNKNLLTEIKRNAFRSDLYYRISTFKMTMPPLRALLKDAPIPLDDYYHPIHDIFQTVVQASEHYKGRTILSDKAFFKLLKYHYPGNFRELINVLSQALLERRKGKAGYVVDEDAIEFEQLPFSSNTENEQIIDVSKMTYKEVMDACRKFEIQKIKELLEKHRGYRDVLRRCAMEMGLVLQNDDKDTKKNKVADFKRKLIKMDITYKQYQK
jgi:transcriptional regulator with PAS, ATPase and Fis domain